MTAQAETIERLRALLAHVVRLLPSLDCASADRRYSRDSMVRVIRQELAMTDTPVIETPVTLPPMTPVQSTNVHAIGYDAANRTAFVQFKSGGTYRYEGVAKELFESIATSASVGKAVQQLRALPTSLLKLPVVTGPALVEKITTAPTPAEKPKPKAAATKKKAATKDAKARR